MSKRPMLSGAQGRKKRKEEEEKRYKDRDALLKFLCPTPANPPVASTSAEQLSSDVAAASCTPPVGSTSAAHLSSDAATSRTSSASPIDPADWPSPLTDKVRTKLVHRGPFQIENSFTFPKQKDGRRCQHDIFNRLSQWRKSQKKLAYVS
uniref:Uncharacterized protein n=1 Tax=Nothobranchius kuhntae TaxID=321403 RepID=A0A1A8INZ8_NOTKU